MSGVCLLRCYIVTPGHVAAEHHGGGTEAVQNLVGKRGGGGVGEKNVEEENKVRMVPKKVDCGIVGIINKSARVAQWIRRRSPKPKIGGSSPPSGTTYFD